MASRFEWDPTKAESNRRKHGIPFEVAIAVFGDPGRLAFDVTRAGDGEVREKAVGRVDGQLITVVFTMRGDICRVISARRSNATEERLYGRPSTS